MQWIGRFVLSQAQRPRRRRALLGSAITVVVLVAVALPALAAAPKSGCWGTCGGDEGPVGGFFITANHKVTQFSIELKCLGLEKIPQPVGPAAVVGDELGPLPTLKISKSQHFSFHGKATAQQPKKPIKVPVSLEGSFATVRKAKIALKVGFGSCRTMHLTIPLRD
jgi:hypothetical protein